jgi:hypothetical protein
VKHHQLEAALRIGVVRVLDDGGGVVVVRGPGENDVVARKFLLEKQVEGGAAPSEAIVGLGVADDAVVFSLHGIVDEDGAGLGPGKIGAVEKTKFPVARRAEDAAPADAGFLPRHFGPQHRILRGFAERLVAVVTVFLFGYETGAEEDFPKDVGVGRG